LAYLYAEAAKQTALPKEIGSSKERGIAEKETSRR
jgi:hypothetical protein